MWLMLLLLCALDGRNAGHASLSTISFNAADEAKGLAQRAGETVGVSIGTAVESAYRADT